MTNPTRMIINRFTFLYVFLRDIVSCSSNNCSRCRTTVCVFLLSVHAGGILAADDDDGSAETLLPQTVQEASVIPTVVGIDEYDDPLEPVNRAIFIFNDKTLRYVLIPLGNAYEVVLPGPVRRSVARVFANLQEPLNLVNHTAQGRFTRAGTNLLRFITNTTLGIGGLFDPAQHWFGMAPDRSTFNATFAHFGIPAGPYLVLPFLGGTDMRGGFSTVTASTLHTVRFLTGEPDTTYIIVFDNFQAIAPNADAYTDLYDQARDPYEYFRNQYLQARFRDNEVQDEK